MDADQETVFKGEHFSDYSDYQFIMYRETTGVPISHHKELDFEEFDFAKTNGLRIVGFEDSEEGWNHWIANTNLAKITKMVLQPLLTRVGRCDDDDDVPCGYHVNEITKGVYGEASKINEELEEFFDALDQDNQIMALLELSDLYGAMKGWLETYHPSVSMNDIIQMSEATSRAFKSGNR